MLASIKKYTYRYVSKGMFPPVMTHCDHDIGSVGTSGISVSCLTHIAELKLTDNLLSEWLEAFLLLKVFPICRWYFEMHPMILPLYRSFGTIIIPATHLNLEADIQKNCKLIDLLH